MSDFASAMAGILRYQKWKRDDWGRPKFVSMEAIFGVGRQMIMTMKDGQCGAWSPSQCDMMADDWTRTEYHPKESDQ